LRICILNRAEEGSFVGEIYCVYQCFSTSGP